ncbi:ATPase synthesis protein 25 mitochondrial [Pestalotiopsis sp. IQ-011]
MLSHAKTLLALAALCASIAGVAAAPQPAVTIMAPPRSIHTFGAGYKNTTTTTPVETVTMACWLPEGCAHGLTSTSTELLVSASCFPGDCSLTWSTQTKVIVAAPTPGA